MHCGNNESNNENNNHSSGNDGINNTNCNTNNNNNNNNNKIDIKDLANIEEISDFYQYTEDCLFIIGSMKMPNLSEIEHMYVELPEILLKKKIAVFDLDETLIHCDLINPKNTDKQINIKLPNGNSKRVSTYV